MVVKRERRTQEERRAETRAKLLAATIECLTEAGYAGTTTRAVAQRAGVSSGAQTHHFPRRVDLVGAAIEDVTRQRIAAIGKASAGLPDDADARAGAVLDLLWADYSNPFFTLVVKLWAAAADDPELYERLVPLERMFARAVAAAIADLRAVYDREDLDARVLTVLATLRGLALTEAFEPRRGRRTDQWRHIRPVLERVLLTP